MKRGVWPPLRNGSKGFKQAKACKRGHPFRPGTFRVEHGRRSRRCLICLKEWNAAYYKLNKGIYALTSRVWTLKNPERAKEFARRSYERWKVRRYKKVGDRRVGTV